MKWIKVEREDTGGIEDSGNTIYVSKNLADKLKTQTKLIFGQNEIPITVQASSSIDGCTGDHFHDPALQGFLSVAVTKSGGREMKF